MLAAHESMLRARVSSCDRTIGWYFTDFGASRRGHGSLKRGIVVESRGGAAVINRRRRSASVGEGDVEDEIEDDDEEEKEKEEDEEEGTEDEASVLLSA